LFGHAKGAFTGAERERPGKFLLADGGTIFLDEVGELPLSVQSKLLRVLQSGEIQPVGKDEVKTVNVRVIAATNRDLAAEVAAGNFRADLYHRLSVYPITVPALKERQQDVLLLAGYFLELTARKLGIRQLKLSTAAQSVLLQYNWPGNVRELEHVISRAALKARKEAKAQDIIALLPQHLELAERAVSADNNPQAALPMIHSNGLSLKAATEEFQKQQIIHILSQTAGNWSLAAQQLGVDRANLARLAKRLGIKVEKTVRS
jgi:anaerobic nitric oxide reductase transcription regulator